jgi:hypothetical protein
MKTPVDAFVKSPAVRETLMAAPESTTPSGPLPLAEAPALAPFHSNSGFDGIRDIQSSDTDEPKKESKPADVATNEILFGSFPLNPGTVSSAGRRQASAPRESCSGDIDWLA